MLIKDHNHIRSLEMSVQEALVLIQGLAQVADEAIRGRTSSFSLAATGKGVSIDYPKTLTFVVHAKE